MKRCETCPRQLPPPVDIRKRFCGVCLAERERIQNRASRARDEDSRSRKRFAEIFRARARGEKPMEEERRLRAAEMLKRSAEILPLLDAGMSTRKAARTLGISVGVVAGLQHRRRKHLTRERLRHMEQAGA